MDVDTLIGVGFVVLLVLIAVAVGQLPEQYRRPPGVCGACLGGRAHWACRGRGCEGCGESGDCPACVGPGHGHTDGGE